MMIALRSTKPLALGLRSAIRPLSPPSPSSSLSASSIAFRYSTSSSPPRKSYTANSTGLRLLWNHTIPINFKYFGVIGASAYSFIHFHPDTLITVVPPLLIGSYFGYRYYYRQVAQREINKVLQSYHKDGDDTSTGNKIQIKKYDESEVWNVLHGIENEFDHFKLQLIDVIEQRILNYIVRNHGPDQLKVRKLFIDQENDEQFSINIHENEVETWIMNKIDVQPDEFADKIEFIKFSLPFYSSKDKTVRKRLGVIQVYLLQVPTSDDSTEYKEYQIGIEITQYALFSNPANETIFISSIDGEGITKSKILSQGQNGRHESEDEEITL